MSIKKVLITGAGGLMGGYVIDELIGHYDLHGIDILPDKKGLPHTQDTILNLNRFTGRSQCTPPSRILGYFYRKNVRGSQMPLNSEILKHRFQKCCQKWSKCGYPSKMTIF